jgi:hypothetical protein
MRSKLDHDDLRDQLIDILEALLEAQLRAIRKMRQSRDRQIMATDERGTKRMSHVDIVHEILRTARRPLHITEILKLASTSMAVIWIASPLFQLSPNEWPVRTVLFAPQTRSLS